MGGPHPLPVSCCVISAFVNLPLYNYCEGKPGGQPGLASVQECGACNGQPQQAERRSQAKTQTCPTTTTHHHKKGNLCEVC